MRKMNGSEKSVFLITVVDWKYLFAQMATLQFDRALLVASTRHLGMSHATRHLRKRIYRKLIGTHRIFIETNMYIYIYIYI